MDEERVKMRGDLKVIHDDIDDLSRAVERNTRMLLTTLLTIAGSAVTFSFTVLVATGRI